MKNKILLKPEQHFNDSTNNNKWVMTSKFSKILRLLFPVFFLISFSICCHWYAFHTGKLFAVYGTDSVFQFMYFIPFVQKAFLSAHPFWSWSYGLGGDVFGQFSYYYSTSPFFYLMLLLRKLGIGSWSLESTLRWKLLFSIFKQSLAMWFLYLLLKYEGKKTYTSLIGAVIYGGCINFMWFSLYFDFMSDAYVWLPLTILGWRIYNKTDKWLLFIVSAALTAANSFYFGFISFIFYIIFILIFINIKGENFRNKVLSFFSYILKYFIFIIIVLGLSAVAFLPSILAFLKTDRFSTAVNIPAFYDSSYILQLPEKLFFYSSSLGFPLIILIVFALPWGKLSLTTKKKTILAGIFFILYLIPLSGSFFNGLSYSCDRWFYLFIFSVAYAIPDWLEENDRLKSVGFHFFSIIIALSLFFYYTKDKRGFNYIIMNAKLTWIINGLIIALGFVSLLTLTIKKYTSKPLAINILSCVAVLSVSAVLIINTSAYLFISPPNMTKELLQDSSMDNTEIKEIFNKLTPSSNEFYRTVFRNISQENAPLNYGYYGTSAYSSMIDGNLHKWLKVDCDILNPYVCPNRYKNFDDRLFLETNFGVKYLVTDKNNSYIPSYGYVLNKETSNYYVYENKYNVGFDLWYTNTASGQTYKNMNIAQRDTMLLQTATVDKNIPGLSKSSVDNVTTEIPLNMSNAATQNVEYKDGILTAGKDASISIPLANNQNSNDGEILFSINIKPIPDQMIKLNVNGKSAIKMEDSYPYSYPLNKFTFRLDGNTKVIKMDISEGKYIISNTHAWFNSYKYYENWINERNKYNLENLHINGGNVKGTIRNNEKGILALNIPFCKGWSAKVDGKSQKLIKVNGVLTGLVLNPGSHTVELRYRTPGLTLGAFISFTFFIGITTFYIINRRHKRSTNNARTLSK